MSPSGCKILWFCAGHNALVLILSCLQHGHDEARLSRLPCSSVIYSTLAGDKLKGQAQPNPSSALRSLSMYAVMMMLQALPQSAVAVKHTVSNMLKIPARSCHSWRSSINPNELEPESCMHGPKPTGGCCDKPFLVRWKHQHVLHRCSL